MFHMSRRTNPSAEMVRALHFIPVSVSYEYDPCDLAKARELHTRASTGDRKAPARTMLASPWASPATRAACK